MFKRILVGSIVITGTIITYLSKTLKQGSGTSAPGYIIEKFLPSAIKYLGQGYTEVIMISGTNGKTTTRALINKIYNDQNIPIVSNFGGANIMRGIVTALIRNRTWYGQLKSNIAILEVEEATLPKLTKYIPATTLILTNIFRDQLDAYGEIDQTLSYFKTALDNSHNPKLIINTDDNKLTNYLAQYLPHSVGFGIDHTKKPKYESKAKTKIQPSQTILAKNISISEKSEFTVNLDQKYEVQSSLPGIFNIYNIAAAIAATYNQFGNSIFNSIENFENVFGRGESVKVDNTTYKLFLVKNPAGLEEVLNYIVVQNIPKLNLTLAINDNTADGKDVSWLWDVDFESFIDKQAFSSLQTSGKRGLDMLLRLEYAGAVVNQENYIPTKDLLSSLQKDGRTHYVLCTYTALLEIRKELSKKTSIKNINDESN